MVFSHDKTNIVNHLWISVSEEKSFCQSRNIHHLIQSQGWEDVPATAYLPTEQKVCNL